MIPRLDHRIGVPLLAMADLPTRFSIWLALALFAAAQLSRRSPGAQTDSASVWFSALGLLAFASHVILAFEFHYDWNHATALAKTAAQTEALTGVSSGNGLYLNYLFGLVWLAEVCWWTNSTARHTNRTNWIERAVRGFFLFMIVNGAVVFVDAPRRWLGMVVVSVLLYAWRPSTRTGQNQAA